MKIEGNGFRYFIDGKEVLYKDLQTMIRLDMTVSVAGLNVYYSSPKKVKDRLLLAEEFKKKALDEIYFKNPNFEKGQVSQACYTTSDEVKRLIKERQEYSDKLAKEMTLKYETPLLKAARLENEKINGTTDKTMNRLIEEELERQQAVSSSPKRRAVLTFNYPANLTNNYYPHDGSKEGIKAVKQKITEELERQEQKVFQDWDSRIDNIIDSFAQAGKRGDTIRRNPSGIIGIEEITDIMTEDKVKKAWDKNANKSDYALGKKENNGKIDYSEIDFDILDLMANRFNANKHKYPHGNMLKPIEEKELLFALFRHLKKMIQPIDNDPETFEEHLASILCNAQMVYQQRKLNKN